MNIIEKKITEITPYENNPRRNEQAIEAVANSINEYGFKNPIIIDEAGEIIAGHTRYAAAKKLKLKKVPCILVDDLTDAQVQAFRLADNKVSELAIWDFEKLQEEIDAIEKDLSPFGFTEEVISDIDLDNILGDEKVKTVTCPHCGEDIEI